MSILKELAQGLGPSLRDAGGVYSPQVFMANEQRYQQSQVLEANRKQNMFAVLVNAIQAGAIDPVKGQQAIQQLGYDIGGIGPSAAAQENMAQAQERQRMLQLQKASQEEISADMQRMEALQTQAEKEAGAAETQRQFMERRAASLLGSPEPDFSVEAAPSPQSAQTQALNQQQGNMGGSIAQIGPGRYQAGTTNVESTDKMRAHNEALALKWMQSANPITREHGEKLLKSLRENAPKNVQFQELATGQKIRGVDGSEQDVYQQYRWMPDGSKIPEGAPFVKQGGVKVSVTNIPQQAIPESAQTSMTGARKMYDALQTVRKYVGKSGIVEGWKSKLMAGLGLDPEAIAFETAVQNMQVLAQEVIKGIPSNFDVQTFIKTLPSITVPESVNQSRIEFSENAVKQLLKDSIAYYKGMKYSVPQHIIDDARAMGINLDDVYPWRGSTDPFYETSRIVKEQTQGTSAPASPGLPAQQGGTLRPSEGEERLPDGSIRVIEDGIEYIWPKGTEASYENWKRYGRR